MNKGKSDKIFQPWLRLIAGITAIGLLFGGAMAVTRRSPLLAVHQYALNNNIDTTAFFYTDIEECSIAEIQISYRLE